MPKIVRGGQPESQRVNVVVSVSAPAAVQLTAAQAEVKKLPEPAMRYEHNPDDHQATPDGAMLCVCVCDRCWPTSGGPCPDSHGPTAEVASSAPVG